MAGSQPVYLGVADQMHILKLQACILWLVRWHRANCIKGALDRNKLLFVKYIQHRKKNVSTQTVYLNVTYALRYIQLPTRPASSVKLRAKAEKETKFCIFLAHFSILSQSPPHPLKYQIQCTDAILLEILKIIYAEVYYVWKSEIKGVFILKNVYGIIQSYSKNPETLGLLKAFPHFIFDIDLQLKIGNLCYSKYHSAVRITSIKMVT
jgi:hypothetical protein